MPIAYMLCLISKDRYALPVLLYVLCPRLLYRYAEYGYRVSVGSDKLSVQRPRGVSRLCEDVKGIARMDQWQTDGPMDGPKEACGVFGIHAPGLDVARITYFGLFALQHRGQESAGIASTDGITGGGLARSYPHGSRRHRVR